MSRQLTFDFDEPGLFVVQFVRYDFHYQPALKEVVEVLVESKEDLEGRSTYDAPASAWLEAMALFSANREGWSSVLSGDKIKRVERRQ